MVSTSVVDGCSFAVKLPQLGTTSRTAAAHSWKLGDSDSSILKKLCAHPTFGIVTSRLLGVMSSYFTGIKI